MSELNKFIFDGLPVRGSIVRLTDAWTDILARRETNEATGAWPGPVAELLGEMAAAGVLMQSNIKFNGALVMQVYGDGPLQLLVVECQADLTLRATAKVRDEPIADDISLRKLVNRGGRGRFAITLDPKDPLPGQQPYQGVVPLEGDSVADRPAPRARRRRVQTPDPRRPCPLRSRRRNAAIRAVLHR